MAPTEGEKSGDGDQAEAQDKQHPDSDEESIRNSAEGVDRGLVMEGILKQVHGHDQKSTLGFRLRLRR